MPFEIKMPQLGLTMESGTLLNWLVEEGDPITEGQGIFEVETDKAAVVVEAHQEGVIERMLVKAGETVAVGAPVAVAVEPGDTLPTDWRPSQSSEEATAKPDSEAACAAPAMSAEKGSVLASWKARTMAREADLELGHVDGSGPGGRVVAADVSRALLEREAELSVKTEASPVAANLAASLGLELSVVEGSGPQGRILQADVIEAAAAIIQGRGAMLSTPQAQGAQVRERVPLTGVRGIVSERMAASAGATARVTMFREADATALIELRDQYRRREIEVSYNDVLVRICARALCEHPGANARLGEGAIEWLDSIHVGLAVDTDRGLLVPVVHNVERMSLVEIARESGRLIEAARAGECTPEELTGGTFTITNLGMLGVEGFTPVINLPECCILGVGRIVRKPVADGEDAVAVRPMMTLSLAFDHRVIDGAPAARLLDRIAELVEEPRLML